MLFQEPVYTSHTVLPAPLPNADALSTLDQEVTVYRNQSSQCLQAQSSDHPTLTHSSHPSEPPNPDIAQVDLTDRLRSELQHLFERSPDKGRSDPHCKCIHVLTLLLEVLPLSEQAKLEINQVTTCLQAAREQ